MCARKIPSGEVDRGTAGGGIRKPSALLTVIFFAISMLSILGGIIGYRYYHRIVEKNQPVFFCLLPAVALAIITLAIAIFLNRLRIRKVAPLNQFMQPPSGVWVPPEMAAKRKEETLRNMRDKHLETTRFLTDIEEQHSDGLLSERTYETLKKDYTIQLHVIEGVLSQLGYGEKGKGEVTKKRGEGKTGKKGE